MSILLGNGSAQDGRPDWIPSRLYILGREWEVLWKNPITLDGVEVDGLCHPQDKIIEINSKLEGEELVRVFIHELLHAIFPIGVLEDARNSDIEERLVDSISASLSKVMMDNDIAVPKTERIIIQRYASTKF